MDLSYVSGPSNLDAVLNEGAKVETNFQTSREGYIGFLTIIDVATRKLQTHPLKNKEPPIKFIDSFLRQHGIRKDVPSQPIITTTEGGYLSRFRAFENAAHDRNYEVKTTEENYVNELVPDWLEATITTDGGGELYKSTEFQHTCNNLGYGVFQSAADASFQNGIVERPHRALKERMRCMLYASRLGTEFWADALLHCTWLYNQTYHSAIKMTPYQAYTG